MKSALFTGFEILDPVKKPVKKLQNKIRFHRFFTGFDPVKCPVHRFSKFHPREEPLIKHEN